MNDLPIKRKIRVGIVDDHLALRLGVRAMLETDPAIEVAGEAQDAASVFELVAKTPLDVLVLDIKLPGKNGIRIARELRVQRPELKIVMFSAYDKPQYIQNAQRAGAHAYLVKTDPNLLSTLHAVAAGFRLFPDESSLGPAPWDVLTKTQLDVAILVASGFADKETAERLKNKLKTVQRHRQDIRERLRRLTPPINADPIPLARWLSDWGELDDLPPSA
jgi:DNA-binding NarL/FixJ family response regulator